MTFTRTQTVSALGLAAGLTSIAVFAIAATNAGKPSAPVQFTTHVITDQIRGGYMVAIADVNHDGKLDIIPVAAGTPEFAWYENPSWTRHVMLNDKHTMLWTAAADIDGDGIPEFALLADFGRDPKSAKGSIWLVKSNGDPNEMWKSYLVDSVPTAHRAAWADLEGNGKKELLVTPLVGAKGWEEPKYHDNVPVFYWRVPAKLDGAWTRETLDATLYGQLHDLHPVKWDPGKRDDLLITGFPGIVLYTPSGHGNSLKFDRKVLSPGGAERPAPGDEEVTKGANDVFPLYIKGKRFLAAEEPFHGDEIVVYTDKHGKWERNVIFKGLVQGHEMAVGDLNGDGRDDIVAVDVTNRAHPMPASVHVFYSEDDAGTQWRHELVDENNMAGSGVVVADINGDGRPDIVAISGNQVKYYENMGAAK